MLGVLRREELDIGRLADELTVHCDMCMAFASPSEELHVIKASP